MKKTLIIIAIIISILVINKETKVIIPQESIRFRVIANSDNKIDQSLKKKIVNNLTPSLINIKSNNINEVREKIKEELPLYTKIVEKTIKEENVDKDFHINYGKNYFPEKEYKGVIYQEGEYESLVVTLGDGKGKNFWCVLFPPLCMVDKNENTEYKSLIKEIIEKF